VDSRDTTGHLEMSLSR